jgi:hypothetical protein
VLKTMLRSHKLIETRFECHRDHRSLCGGLFRTDFRSHSKEASKEDSTGIMTVSKERIFDYSTGHDRNWPTLRAQGRAHAS